MIQMRQANIGDAEALFSWRNDPVTCANSKSTAEVAREEHDQWMRFNVLHGYPTHLVLIGESDAGRVGVVRFDAQRGDVMRYDVSITTAPKHRGKGLGEDMLKQACSIMQEYTLTAEVRRENIASRRIFENCGFEQVSPNDHFVKYRRHPLT